MHSTVRLQLHVRNVSVEKSVAMHDETKTVKTVRFEKDTNERLHTKIANAKEIQRQCGWTGVLSETS